MDELRQSFESIREKLKDLFNRVNQLEAAPTVTSGSGGGAPVDAQYLTLAFNATLTQERRLDFSARFATVDGGAGADYDVDLAASGVGAGIYGSATQVPQITVDTYGRLTNVANIAITGFITGVGAAGRVTYWTGASTIGGEDALWYDSANNRLGVNDNAPDYTLDVNGIIGINGVQTIYNAAALGLFTGTLYVGNGGTALLHTGLSEGYYNTAVGINSLNSNTTGYQNASFGYRALYLNTTGHHNAALGDFALRNNTQGNNNIAVGSQALNGTDTGSSNVGIGHEAVKNNVSGSNNVGIGYQAGMYTSLGFQNTDGSDSVFIGYDARPSANTQTNQIVIGALSRGNGSNTTTIGDITITDCYIRGNIITEEDHFVGIASGVRIVFDDSSGFIEATLGDAAGSDKLQIVDSGTNVVAYIDSNGNEMLDGLTASTFIYSNASKIITSLANGAGYLTNNGAGVFSWSASTTPSAHNLLSATHGDTSPTAVIRGDLIYGKGIAPVWESLAISVPAANVRNVLGVDNGDVEPSWKTALDATNPTTLTAVLAAAPGTSLIFSHRDHAHAITNTSDGDTNPSTILSSDANGGLRLDRLGINVAPIAAAGTIALSDGGYIGNGAATARIVFDSSGATDYTYIRASRVVVNTGTPIGAQLDIAASGTTGIFIERAAGASSIKAGPTDGYLMLDSNGQQLRLNNYVADNVSIVNGGGNLAIGTTAANGKTTIYQSGAASAIPVLELNQADLSEEFINFICATTGAGDPVDTATAVGAAYARLRIAVNGTFKYIQLYNA